MAFYFWYLYDTWFAYPNLALEVCDSICIIF